MKKFISGALFGAFLMIGVTAYADVQGMVGKVVDGVFSVKVDESTLENEAIVIEGTSYLPVRELAEKVGYEVSFDMEEGIELKKETVPVPIPENQTSNPNEGVPGEEENIIPRLESYNHRIESLNVLLDGHKQWNNLTEDQVKEYTELISQLEAEREEHYPDWNKTE